MISPETTSALEQELQRPEAWEPEEVFRELMENLRTGQGITRRQLSQRLKKQGVDLTEQAIYLIEKGKTKKVSLGAAIAIAAELDVPLEDLYRTPLPWSDYIARRNEEPGISEPLAWLRTLKRRRVERHERSTTTPKEGP